MLGGEVIMRGRPRKPVTINHVVGTRLTDGQFLYLKKVAQARHCSMGTALRCIVEQSRRCGLHSSKHD